MLRRFTALRFRAEITSQEQLLEALSCDYEYIYAPARLLCSDLPEKNRIIAVPPAFRSESPHKLREIRDMGFTRVLAHTLGHIQAARESGMTIHGGFRLNITNSIALNQYEKLGLTDTVLSIELNISRIKAIKAVIPAGIIAYGRLPMMLLRRFPDYDGLTDRKNKFLPLVRNKGEAELLNPVPLILSDKINDFSAVNFAVLRLTDEKPGEILNGFKESIKPELICENFTRGLYYK